MTKDVKLVCTIAVRVTQKDYKKFHTKAKGFPGGAPLVLREIVEAFLEGRLQITPPTKMKETLYVTRIDN